eukprot:56566-Prymnesium_polylepis.1
MPQQINRRAHTRSTRRCPPSAWEATRCPSAAHACVSDAQRRPCRLRHLPARAAREDHDRRYLGRRLVAAARRRQLLRAVGAAHREGGAEGRQPPGFGGHRQADGRDAAAAKLGAEPSQHGRRGRRH